MVINVTHEEVAILKEVLKSWDGWIQSDRRNATPEEKRLIYELEKKIPDIPK